MTEPARTWPRLLAALLAREDLTADDARWAMREVMDDACAPAELAAFLVALRAKGETAEEISGMLDAVMEGAVPLPVDGAGMTDIDDTGLAVRAWNGLPGALVAWFLDAVGPQGIIDMAQGLDDRRATVATALGYADSDGVRVFNGTVDGSLATEPRGASGFGCDAVFIPGNDHRTYAEMTREEKNEVSHRRRAVDAMRESTGLG